MSKLNQSLQESLNAFLAFLATYHDKIAEYDEAKKATDGLKNLHAQIAGAIEDELADLAVRFQIPAYIGDYGNGRSVQLVEHAYEDYAVGEWVPSSSRC